jgi:hypothetical protein
MKGVTLIHPSAGRAILRS